VCMLGVPKADIAVAVGSALALVVLLTVAFL
jgi:hypothetical protein